MITKEEIDKILEENKETIAFCIEENKRNRGIHDVEECMSEGDNLDRRKFGKLHCGFCSHPFNPFYTKTLKDKSPWQWVWVGTEHKQPEKDYYVNCPKCKELLYFGIYIPQ